MGLIFVTSVTCYLSGVYSRGRYKQNQSLEQSQKSRDKWGLIISLIINLGVLFFFKYYNFFIESFVDAFSLFGKHLNINTLKIILPVGISFYTFTALSYTIDVYKKKVDPTRDVLAFFAYVSFFPALFCGPIGRATKQLPQFYKKRIFNYGGVTSGLKLMLWGFFMKLCIADRLGLYVDAVYNNIGQHNGTTLFLASILYTIQIYADFGGYSLIAIGCGKLLGIDLQTNFIRPYFATTVTDFWRRWHISLTTWFRDYIYFPLGGNRVKKSRWMLNTMIVFVVSGLWHGAAYTFLIWGALHGVCMIVERLIYGDRIKSISKKITFSNILRIFITFNVVSIAWIFFRVASIGGAFEVIEKIYTSLSLHIDFISMKRHLFYTGLLVMILCIKDIMDELFPQSFYGFNNRHRIIRWVFYYIIILLIICFGFGTDSGNFIYFNF